MLFIVKLNTDVWSQIKAKRGESDSDDEECMRDIMHDLMTPDMLPNSNVQIIKLGEKK